MISKAFFAAASRLVIHPLHRFRRGMTLGVRVMAINPQGEVMLVRHRFGPGWLFPGGGVERGETIWEAAAREADEEAGLSMTGPPELFGFYNNDKQMRGDHLAFFVAREFQVRPVRPNLEIAEARFFPAGNLPEGTTGGTRRRLAEVLSGLAPSGRW